MEKSNNGAELNPGMIMTTGLGFMFSKVLLSAVNMEIFTMIASRGAMSAMEIKQQLGFQCMDRHVYDYLDLLSGMNLLHREGLLENARYSNSPEADFFLDKRKPAYIGGILSMANNRLYKFWDHLEEGLRSGAPQNEIKSGMDNPFAELYADPQKLEEFVNAMSGIQMGNFLSFAQKFDFSAYHTLVDAGGSGALLSIMVASHHPHMQCTSFDLAPVEPIAKANIERFQQTERVKTAAGDFFNEAIPPADLVVMGNILHDWSEDKKLFLMQQAYNALPVNGAFVAIENIIDDDRSQNTFGLAMSLNMLIETGRGFDYTFNDFKTWAHHIGFRDTAILPLAGPSSAAIAFK